MLGAIGRRVADLPGLGDDPVLPRPRHRRGWSTSSSPGSASARSSSGGSRASSTATCRDLVPTGRDLRALPRDIADHARLRFHHTRDYNVLQKLVLCRRDVRAFSADGPDRPLHVAPFNAAAPWLLDVFGGRQTARTIHFAVMLLLVAFFVVHVLMVLLAGPLNELRSMITGWYRIDPEHPGSLANGR